MTKKPSKIRKRIAIAVITIIIPTVILFSDFDGDGLSNIQEISLGTLINPDTDGDGLSDGSEVNTYLTDPLKKDTDGDGLEDKAELDGWHVDVGYLSVRFQYLYYLVTSDPLKHDTDGDGLSDYEEWIRGTDPKKLDTDEDGLPDYNEVLLLLNPRSSDTDKDGIPDGHEVENMAQFGANPRRRDIFVEIDRMEGTRWLTETEKTDLINAFNAAPILNPDGTWGVRLHLVENDLVPFIDVWNRDNYGNKTSVNPERHHAAYYNYRENYRSYGEGFYYCVLTGGGSYSYGLGFTVSVIGAPPFTAAVFMHELGHSLGLDPTIFDGIDSDKYTVDEYPSVMHPKGINTGILRYSAGGVFNDWAYLENQGFRKWY